MDVPMISSKYSSCNDDMDWMSISIAEYLAGERPARKQMVKGLVDQVQSYLQNQPCKTILSIGPGIGTVDAIFLEQFRDCSNYYGVEPSPQDITKLEELLSCQFPRLKLNLINCPVEKFVGPDELADVIIASFVVHFLSDRVGAIRCLLNWLTDDGLLIFMCCENCTVIQSLQHYYKEHKHLYTKKDLLADILTAGGNIISEKPTKDQRYDFRDLSQGMANAHLKKEANPCEIMDLKNFLYSKYPSGIADVTEWIILVKK